MKKVFLLLALLVVLIPAQAGAFDVTLAWDASLSPDVAYYSIHWSTQEGVYNDSPLDVGGDLTGSITNLVNGTMYYFVVSCTDIEGLQSGYSNMVFTDGVMVIPDGEPPYAPGGCYIVTVTP